MGEIYREPTPEDERKEPEIIVAPTKKSPPAGVKVLPFETKATVEDDEGVDTH